MVVSIKYKCLSRQVVLLIGSESARFNHKNHSLQIFSIFRFGILKNITIFLKKYSMIINAWNVFNLFFYICFNDVISVSIIVIL